MERGENSPDHTEVVKARSQAVTQPSLMQKATSLATSTAQWVSRGFPVVSESALTERLAICKGCEFWNAEGFGGTGRCQKCGCSTAAKLRMATASCPEGKWGVEEKLKVES
jgi:hypothetical protein